MKRFFAAFLALACILSLSACREEHAAAKPVIYLYPEKETTVTVKLDYAGTLTCDIKKRDGSKEEILINKKESNKY